MTIIIALLIGFIAGILLTSLMVISKHGDEFLNKVAEIDNLKKQLNLYKVTGRSIEKSLHRRELTIKVLQKRVWKLIKALREKDEYIHRIEGQLQKQMNRKFEEVK